MLGATPTPIPQQPAAAVQPVQSPVPHPPQPSGNLPTRNNNPGDLRDQNGNFMVFSTPQEGYAALLNDLQAKIEGRTKTGLSGSSTLADFANKWDPAGDGGNNPAQYAANLANKLGVSPATPLSQLQGRIGDLANAIASNEGMQTPPKDQSTAPALPGIGELPTAAGNSTPPPTASTPDPEAGKGFFSKLQDKIGGIAQGTVNTLLPAVLDVIKEVSNFIKPGSGGVDDKTALQKLGDAGMSAACSCRSGTSPRGLAQQVKP